MIVYQATKQQFLQDIFTNNIENIILASFQKNLGRTTTHNEVESWKSSMMYMNNVLNDEAVPADSIVAIEYQIPHTSKRIDFILTGQNATGQDFAIIVELKQWSEVDLTDKSGIVSTFVGGNKREVSHPSYQAWSYAAILQDFNETVYKDNIQLKPCAYLHNYSGDGVINNAFYQEYIDRAPLFLKSDAKKLREFIKEHIKKGDRTNIMKRIEGGRIKPSKALVDGLAEVIKGSRELVMIDDQKIVFEAAMKLARESSPTNKNVLIVQGGPGTGKTVVAINLVINLIRESLSAKYVTKNAAPRAVYEHILLKELKKSSISHLFSGSGSFIDTPPNTFNALIVDEAHRLNEKSGMFRNLGENQVKELIDAAAFTVFFVDEDQKVTWHDIGSVDEIKKWALLADAKVHTLELQSQFRCNGEDGYLPWLDNVLQIRETANTTFDPESYDFRVVDSPNELRDLIFEKNKERNRARLVAGYCWDWVSKKNKNLTDINLPEHDFRMRWNLASEGNLWIVGEDSVNEVGCIHSSQGLELDYVGVIVGPDLIVRDGKVITQPEERASTDASLKGYKTALKLSPELARARADAIIKNTYRTLMTRGMKGCYVYFCDSSSAELFNHGFSK